MQELISFGYTDSERGAQNVTENWEGPHNVNIIISELKDVIDGLLDNLGAVFHVKHICDIFYRYQDSQDNMEVYGNKFVLNGAILRNPGGKKMTGVERSSISILPLN